MKIPQQPTPPPNGPDAKHPNWEPDPADEAYTCMRDGDFKGWEEFARFCFEVNKKLQKQLTDICELTMRAAEEKHNQPK